MDVVARVPLEPRRSLYVVEVAGKTLLVGTSEMGLSVLSELDARRGRGAQVGAAAELRDMVSSVATPTARRERRKSPRGASRATERRASRQRMSNAVLLALVAIVPLVILMLTSFVKMSVVLSLVRNAIGAPDAPSGLVVTGLSLVLTFFVMAPVAVEMVHAAATRAPPGDRAGAAARRPATARGARSVPARAPAARSTRRSARSGRCAGSSRSTRASKDGRRSWRSRRSSATTATGDELWVLAPAFVTTELREAFAIAVLIFMPFLVIDLVVGLGLASLGLTSTSPQTSRCRSSCCCSSRSMAGACCSIACCEGTRDRELVARRCARACCSCCCSRRRCWSPR